MSESVSIVRVELVFNIASQPNRVWDVMVNQTGKWWPRDFYSDARATTMMFEPRLGGRLYEDWGGGGEGRGRTWYTIETYDPPHVLELAGHLYPAYGGPSVTLVRIELEAAGEGETRLKLSDAVIGRVGEGTKKSLEEGWTALFGIALGRYCERQ